MAHIYFVHTWTYVALLSTRAPPALKSCRPLADEEPTTTSSGLFRHRPVVRRTARARRPVATWPRPDVVGRTNKIRPRSSSLSVARPPFASVFLATGIAALGAWLWETSQWSSVQPLLSRGATCVRVVEAEAFPVSWELRFDGLHATCSGVTPFKGWWCIFLMMLTWICVLRLVFISS